MAAPNKRIKISHYSRSTVSGSLQTLLVPTITEKEPQTVDLHSMNKEEIKALQMKDPFLYYSITGARGAFSLNEVDFLSKATKSAHHVLRKTRVSVETHDTLLLEDDLLKNGLGLDLEELDDLLDDLLLKLK